MTAIDLEAVVALDRAQERTELARRQLDHRFASLADEVLVFFVGEVVDGASVSEVHVVDDVDLLERVERSVDGRDVDRREPAVDVGGEFVGGDVSLRGEHGLDDHLARGRAPSSGR